MKGKCNCGKKAIKEFLVRDFKDKTVWCIKLCENCTPQHDYTNKHLTLIDG